MPPDRKRLFDGRPTISLPAIPVKAKNDKKAALILRVTLVYTADRRPHLSGGKADGHSK
jgi:hypothetical protein